MPGAYRAICISWILVPFRAHIPAKIIVSLKRRMDDATVRSGEQGHETRRGRLQFVSLFGIPPMFPIQEVMRS